MQPTCSCVEPLGQYTWQGSEVHCYHKGAMLAGRWQHVQCRLSCGDCTKIGELPKPNWFCYLLAKLLPGCTGFHLLMLTVRHQIIQLL